MKQSNTQWNVATLMAIGLMTLSTMAHAEVAATPPPPVDMFASVNGELIPISTYKGLFAVERQKRFYHMTPPESQFLEFQAEIGQQLIETALMLQEAKRQDIAVDEEWVKRELAQMIAYERLGTTEEEIEQNRERVQATLQDRNRLDQLEKQVRVVAEPTESQIDSFYQQHPDKFTTPGQERVGLILVKVDPWAGADSWEIARLKSSAILESINNGVPFEELARQYSDDATAANGGDMGFQHEGMLGVGVAAAIKELKIGEISRPIQLLEGIAILRLIDRIEPKLNPIPEIVDRLKALWVREEMETVYKRFVAQLVAAADIQYLSEDYKQKVLQRLVEVREKMLADAAMEEAKKAETKSAMEETKKSRD